jgi:putative restriction endonuclease
VPCGHTGHGGRDPNTGKQIADQKLTRGNLALAKNVADGVPVRVIRKVDGQFRYDGLYRVEQYWPEKGHSGFVVYRYRLIRDDITLPQEYPSDQSRSGAGGSPAGGSSLSHFGKLAPL